MCFAKKNGKGKKNHIIVWVKTMGCFVPNDYMVFGKRCDVFISP